jgi:cytochrome o ubiquinol oxidase subunit IV
MKSMDGSIKNKKTRVKHLWSGLILSFVLTLMSYFVVTRGLLGKEAAMYTISALAVLQAFIQLILFLNLGSERSPKWNLLTFLFMLVILVIIVVGTIWIMFNIDYNLMLT